MFCTRKWILALLALVLATHTSQAQLGGLGLSKTDIVSGLKAALNQGVEKSVTTLMAQNGYWNDLTVRIPLPPQAKNLYSQATKIPGLGASFQKEMDDFQRKMNKAAEGAANKAKPIFVNAITSMSINDGLTILKGDSLAATTYLKNSTYGNLTAAFQPAISQSLKDSGAQQAWANLIKIYNPAVKTYNASMGKWNGKSYEQLPTDLSLFVTQKALDGLFMKVGLEEKRIRRDPAARLSDILKKVFK